MDTPDITKLNDSELIQQYNDAEMLKKAADGDLKKLKNEILRRCEREIKALYAAKDEPYGIVHADVGGSDVSFDTTKKVEWAQDKLAALWNQIIADGGDPKEYIKVEYSVGEALWKSWGANLKAHFEPARTVKPGSVSIKISDKE